MQAEIIGDNVCSNIYFSIDVTHFTLYLKSGIMNRLILFWKFPGSISNIRRSILPKTSKKQSGPRCVELSINLNVPRKQLSTVKEALNAIFDLAGLKPSPGKTEDPKSSPPAKRGRPPKGQTPTTKRGQAKPAKTKKTPGRHPVVKNPSKIASLIRSLRTEAGMSQKALASKMGVYQNTISLLEIGKQKPNADMAIKLGKALGTEHQKFLE
jgi:putative transcriptional regulator